MITKTEQNWQPGSIVKIGFMSLMVQAHIPTPKNYRPDAYLLTSAKGQNYIFVPHWGIEKYDGDTSLEAIQSALA